MRSDYLAGLQARSVARGQGQLRISHQRTQFDGVAVDIADVERASHSLCAVALLKLATIDAMGLQIVEQFGFIKGFDLQAEMVEVVTHRRRCAAAGLAQLASDIDDIDQRVAGA